MRGPLFDTVEQLAVHSGVQVWNALTEQRRLLDLQREYTEALTERYKAMADLLFATAAPVTDRATSKEE